MQERQERRRLSSRWSCSTRLGSRSLSGRSFARLSLATWLHRCSRSSLPWTTTASHSPTVTTRYSKGTLISLLDHVVLVSSSQCPTALVPWPTLSFFFLLVCTVSLDDIEIFASIRNEPKGGQRNTIPTTVPAGSQGSLEGRCHPKSLPLGPHLCTSR